MNEIVEKGRDFFRKSQYDAVISLWYPIFQNNDYKKWHEEAQIKFLDLLYRALFRTKQTFEAQNVIEQAILLFPTNYDIGHLWGFDKMVKADWVEAKRRFETLYHIYPNDEKTILELLKCCEALKDDKQYDNFAEKYIELGRHDPKIILAYARSAMRQRQWQNSLIRWQKVIDISPNIHNGYLGLAMTYRELGQLDKAIAAIEHGMMVVPNNPYLLTERILLAEKTKNWLDAFTFTQSLVLIKQNDDVVVSNLGKFYHLHHQKEKDKVDDYFLSLVNDYPNMGKIWYVWATIHFKARDFIKAKICIRIALDYEANIDKKIVYIHEAIKIFKRVDKVQELDDLVALLFNQYPTHEELHLLSINIAQELPKDNYVIALARAKRAINYMVSEKYQILLAEKFTSLGNAEYLGNILQILLANNVNKVNVLVMWCKLAIMEQCWQEAEKRILKTITSYPNEKEVIRELYFDLLYVSQQLQQPWLLEKYFIDGNLFNFPKVYQVLNDTYLSLERLQIHRMMSRCQDLKVTAVDDDIQPKLPKNLENIFRFDKHLMSKLKINHVDNKVLVICFENMIRKIDEIYEKNGFDLSSIDISQIFSGFSHSASGFSDTKHYNFLLLKDIYDTGYHLHFEAYLQLIQQTIIELKPEKIVCFGSSMGGYAGILFGHLIKADYVFAFSPQTTACFQYMTNFSKHLQKIANLGVSNTSDVIHLQKKAGGFHCKTYITLCQNHAGDKSALYGIDNLDKNLLITEVVGHVHVVFAYFEARDVFSEICRIIDEGSNTIDHTFLKNIHCRNCIR